MKKIKISGLNCKETDKQLLYFLKDGSKTIYQISAETNLGVSTLYQKLAVFECKTWITKSRSDSGKSLFKLNDKVFDV